MSRRVAGNRRGGFRLWPWLAFVAGLFLVAPTAVAGPNPGDPLLCQPQGGTGFLIVNGGAGVFSVDPGCFNGIVANDTQLSISTTQGGTLTGTQTQGGINYIYTPPTPGFTGTDTFDIDVLTVWNGAGGTGSAGGSFHPGGPATLTVTLNVLPAVTTLTAFEDSGPTAFPILAGSITGCTFNRALLGPPPGFVTGCASGFSLAGPFPAHGTLSFGSKIQYTPDPGYLGPDTFTYEISGPDATGPEALESGPITMNVDVVIPVPTLSPWATALMIAGLLLLGTRMLRGYRGRPD